MTKDRFSLWPRRLTVGESHRTWCKVPKSREQFNWRCRWRNINQRRRYRCCWCCCRCRCRCCRCYRCWWWWWWWCSCSCIIIWWCACIINWQHINRNFDDEPRSSSQRLLTKMKKPKKKQNSVRATNSFANFSSPVTLANIYNEFEKHKHIVFGTATLRQNE